MKPKHGVLAAVLLALTSLMSFGQDAPNQGDRFRLVSTLRISTLEKELNEGAAAGYRVLGLWYSGQLFAVLEKAAQGSGGTQYRVVDESGLSGLEQKLKDAGAVGFRFVPRTLIRFSDEGSGVPVAVMEKPRDSTARYDYLISTGRAKFTDKEVAGQIAFDKTTLKTEMERAIGQTESAGYTPVAMVGRTAAFERQQAAARWLNLPFGFQGVLQAELTVIGERLVGASSPNSEAFPPGDASRYRLVGAVGGPDLVRELNATASAGYRLAFVVPNVLPYVLAIMERVSEPGLEYAIAGGTDWPAYERLSVTGRLTLKEQLNAASRKGFRVHRDGLVAAHAVVLMERRPASEETYDVELIPELIRRAFDREFTKATSAGYVPLSVSEGGGMMVLDKTSERRPEPTTAPTEAAVAVPFANRRELSISARKLSTLQEKLSDAAAQGYRVVSGSSSGSSVLDAELSLNLASLADPAGTCQYLLVWANGPDKLQKGLNEAAEKGFRFVKDTVMSKPAMVGTDTIVVMEKPPGATAAGYEYRIVGTIRESSFLKETEQTAKEGWTSVAMTTHGHHIAIFERPAPQR